MNLKLNNEREVSPERVDSVPFSSAEERRRTGRYIAIVVGICLLCLAIYQAWIRQVPVLASLLIPALIMLIYVAWILYTANRDKRRALIAIGDGENPDEVIVVGNDQQSALPAMEKPLEKQQRGAQENKEAAGGGGEAGGDKCKEDKVKEFKESEKQFRRCYSIA